MDMRLAAVDAVDQLDAGDLHARKQPYQLFGTWVEYAGPGGHIFTPERLREICEMEATFYRPAEYQDVCVLNDDGHCAIPPLSIVGQFYGSEWLAELVRNGTGTCDLLGTEQVEVKWASMVSAANATREGFSKYGVFMEKGAVAAGATSKTRSLVSVGQPLEGFASTRDRTARQEKTYKAYFEAVEQDLWDHFGVESTFFQTPYLAPWWRRGGLNLRCFSWLIARLETLRMQEIDLYFIICTIIFVDLCIRAYTRSHVFTAAALAQIQLSIPVSAFVYRIVFRIEYFGYLHLCSIFLALGIGADDNFVLFDAWRQAQADVPSVDDADETTLRRLIYAFSRTMDTVFNTSLTTALTFLCLGLSPIMPVRTFGIFAAMVVVCNYVMVLTMIPTCLILCDGCCFWPQCVRKAASKSSEPKSERRIFPPIKPFFEQIYLRYMSWTLSCAKGIPIGAWLSVWCFLVLGIFLGYRALHLEMPREQEELFPKKHMFTGFLDDMANDYEAGADDQYCRVFYTFGINNLGKENYDEYKPDYRRGYAKWNGGFDLHSPAARTALKGFCDAVRSAPCSEHECSMGLLHLPESTICFYEEFEAWKVLRGVYSKALVNYLST